MTVCSGCVLLIYILHAENYISIKYKILLVIYVKMLSFTFLRPIQRHTFYSFLK